MYEQEKKNMQMISNYAGIRVDYVQGGGGNTSYKFDDKIMAIKASGYSLAEVKTETGYVTVDYMMIKQRYEALRDKAAADVEKETLDINMASITLLDGMENKRPSVEVGFHAHLKRAVIHTHSVYANILCCSEEGKEIAKEIFGTSEYGYIFIPFINPGFALSMHIKDEVNKYQSLYGKQPEVIFIESHGIIVHDDDYLVAIDIHEKVNHMIAEYFCVQPFPEVSIKSDQDWYISNTRYIADFINAFSADETYFKEVVLYPDQMVYLGNNLGENILVDSDKGRIIYKTNEKRARVIEEIILGVAYIVTEIKRKNLNLKLLCDEGVDFIRNWESEKYRASIN